MILCENVRKAFGDTQALRDVSLAVPKGTICALLGPNGAGKSTLVNVLTGVVRPDTGMVRIAGVSPADPEMKRIVGVLPESLGLFDLLTVQEHLELTAAVYGIPKAEAKTRREPLLRMLRLEHAGRTFASQCSYGMKKKTALAMALLPAPQVLVLDEPFEGVDPVTAETIRLQLRAIADRGVTVLLTSHILSFVDRIADRVVMIKSGQVVLDRVVSEIPESLDDVYFQLVEQPAHEELRWLGSDRG